MAERQGAGSDLQAESTSEFSGNEYEGNAKGKDDLASKTLHIQAKRFYLDVKQNRGGRFIKVAERYRQEETEKKTSWKSGSSSTVHTIDRVASNGSRSQITFGMTLGKDIRDQLDDFADFYASLDPGNRNEEGESGNLKSGVIRKGEKWYYLDLKENPRGKFLRISQVLRYGGRNQIALPAQGIAEMKDALSDLLDEFGVEDVETEQTSLDSQMLRAESKRIYFDVGKNNRGTFLRITEVRGRTRNAVRLPQSCLSKFKEIISDYCDRLGVKDDEEKSATE
ncbi:uncharacterized protein TRIADDRAFT_51711 [Trichoplax adhaerens]|uniref:Transcriptional activator protein Pur-alpha n=1 Tax=Trichoplax adhaerens TaxID=10228 RepID=B3RKP5_TRIAD|nr:hypothetical protein TRIADDRAFT_51711 [Trichoplax adhaerens]EDV28615.1 hypothetical protein TRIADDRAFT_51711 [Trichoplax adhaerens]|eukprot:XP_002107817.1 hypothetical protein TRIADDRAFT_51711 [Trichoplax adhaerens]